MEWLSYLLKVSACTTFFFAFYLLFLRKLTFFSFNRFYLLISLSISFVIPALQFTIEREVEQVMFVDDTPTVNNVDLNDIPEVPFAETLPTVIPRLENTFNWYALLPYLYTVIVMGFLFITAWRLLQLLKYTRLGKQEINGLKIVSKNVGFTNCSFFNYVFIDEDQLSEAELQVLLRHEKVHAKKYHSIDKLILMVFKAVLWFNPIIYLYDKALEDVHEFEADEITSNTYGTAPYASLLLKLAVAKSESPLVHNFVKSPIKDRIKMLFNTKSKHMKKLMYLLALPVGLGLLWSFTIDVVTVLPKNNIVKQEVRQSTDTLMGKTVKGKIVAFEKMKLEDVMNLQVGNQTLLVSCRTFKDKVKIGDEITVLLSGKSSGVINMTDRYGKKSTITEKPAYMTSKVNAANGRLIYERKVTNYAFLYEVNKARYAWSRIKSFDKNSDGTINQIVLHDNGFTINLNVAAQKFKTEDFKVGDSVVVKFFGEKLIAKNTYSTDKMIVLYSWPKKYELKNEVLYNRFYEKSGKQKIAGKIEEPSMTPEQKSSIKPRLLSSTSANIDNKTGVNYFENVVMEIYNGKLEAEHMVWDSKNQTITAKVAVYKHQDGNTVRSSQIVFDLKKGTYVANQASGTVNQQKVETASFDISNLQYQAQDSVRRTKTGLTLYGKSSLVLGSGVLSAEEIKINTISNLVTANKATLEFDGETFKADQFQYNLLTKKGKVLGAGRVDN